MSAGTEIHLERVFVVPGLSLEDAWDLIADTDRFNALVGLPPIDTEQIPSEHGLPRFRARMTRFPWLSWIEGDWEFVRPRWFRVRREYRGGPLRSFHGGADLTATPGEDGAGVEIRLVGDFVARHAIFAPLLRKGIASDGRKMERRIREAVANRPALPGEPIYSPPPTPLAPGGAERLAGGMARVREVAPDVADMVERFLREGPDLDVLRMRPFVLADRWGVRRVAVLRALLHAAKAGLVNLSWDLMCPHCGVPSFRGKSLREVSSPGRCDVCTIDYGLSFDNAVEVSFSVHPSIRAIEPVVFCLGAPAKRRQTLLQQVLAAGETRRVKIDLPAGEYLLGRADGYQDLMIRTGTETTAAIRRGEAHLDAGGVHSAGGKSEMSLPSGELELVLVNDLGRPARAVLNLGMVASDSATAAMVTALQDFRDLFSSEVLSEGVQIGLSSVTLLFTDLKGSTALYESLGDAPVYARVRAHFDELVASVSEEGGGVVKTIGDAVMASFPSAAAGVRAAMAMQRRITELNQRLGAPDLVVKIGLHAGPCLVINANERLDYFGNTVNTAARIEGQSTGADFVVTDAVARDPEVRALLEAEGIRVTRFEAMLKGLAAAQSLVRIEPGAVREGPAGVRQHG